MWLFGQVWFACLVGFVVGVGLTWLWQVRPLNRRVADLERSARLADRPARQPGRQDAGYRPGFGNSTYDDSTSVVSGHSAPPSSIGVSTPSGRPGLDEMFEPEPLAEPTTHIDTGTAHSVDDYVEALVQEYQGDAPSETRNWANRNPDALESWRPGALGARLDSAEPQEYQEQSGDAQLTSYQPVVQQPDAQLTSYQPVQQQHPEPEPEPESAATEATQLQPRSFGTSYGEFGTRGNADEQYLEYLRSGTADGEPAQATPEHEPEPEVVRDYVEHEPQQEYPAEQQYPEQPYEQQYEEPAEEHPAEVTSVLPPVVDDDEPAEQTVADQEPLAQQSLAQHEDEQAEAGYDYFESSEPLTALVRPHSSGGGPIASAQPFQLSGPDRVDVNSQQGQLTPIEEGGFQPFAKPFGEEIPAEDGAREWQDDWSDESAQVNGTHVDATQHEDAHEETDEAETTGPVPAEVIAAADASSRVEPETAAESTTVFSPITDESPYEEQAPAPRHQIIEADDETEAEQPAEAPAYPNHEYAEQDYSEDYDEDAPASGRSLFEPIIEPEQQTSYLTPVAPPASQSAGQSPQQQQSQQPGQQQTQQLQPQPTGPRPIRVRTGIAQPNRPQQGVEPTRPVRAPAGSAGWQTGPFGPGSALPLPDGSAPSPQFRVKARTSSMVFHTESSPFYERLEPQVWFTSQEDAQRAGFTSWERPRTW